MGILRDALLGAMFCGVYAMAVAADEQEQPEAELLDFLGMWEENNGQWELFVDIASDIDTESEVERSANRDTGLDYE
ncbi:MAG: hypothetical protein VX533_05700 [Pseudomonadota bacterium]|nr:hypothetical protein [Pseudomonadota bacterium]